MKISKDELIFADELLKKHFNRIKDWVVGDIKKCCRLKDDGSCDDNGALVGAFILWCCAVDYFGGLLSGTFKEKDSGKERLHDTKERIRQFVVRYLQKYGKYDPIKIYELRWSLLHFYSPMHYMLKYDANKRKYHLKKTNMGCVLHLSSSIEDLERAVADYLTQLWKNPEMRIKAFRYYKKNLMIKPVDFTKVVFTEKDCD